MTELQDLLKTIRAILTETFLEQEGIRVDTIDVTNIVNRGFSDVVFFRLTTSQGERRVVMKKLVHHPVNQSITKSENQSVVEFNILSQLYPKFQSVPRCKVPRPILVLPEYEAYIMDFVDGHLLGDLLAGARYFAPRNAFDELNEYYFLCGGWLKKLHEFTGIRRADMGVLSSTLERCEVRLKLIDEANDKRCAPGITKRIRNLLHEQIALVKDEDIQVTGRHGDFGSWNIMAGSEGITVFDFMGYRDDLLPIDLLKMLINFEDERLYILYSKNRMDALRKSFLKGYGDVPLVSRPVVTICEAMHRICCLCARVTGPAKRIHRRLEQQFSLNKNLAWLLSDDRRLSWPGKL